MSNATAGILTNVYDLPVDYEYITDQDGVTRAVEWLSTKLQLGLDVETTGLDPFVDKLLLLQLGNEEKVFVFDARRCDLRPLHPILSSETILKIGHNIKFDAKVLLSKGFPLEYIADTMVAEQMLYMGLIEKKGKGQEKSTVPKLKLALSLKTSKKGLPGLAERYLGVRLLADERESFIGQESTEYTTDQLEYAAKDVQLLIPIWRKQLQALTKAEMRGIARVEMAAILPTAEMELNGWRMDVVRWRREIARHARKEQETGKQLLEMMDIRRTVGQYSLFDEEPVDEEVGFTALNSAPRLLEQFQKLGIELETTDKNQINFWISQARRRRERAMEGGTNADPEELARLNAQIGFVEKLLEYRKHSKMVGTYGEKLLGKIHPVTGKLHGKLEQMGTDTGRYSSDAPNLQNFPKERFVRESFIAPEGRILATCDFSQIELRIVAQQSQDEIPIDAFNSGKDLHSLTAAMMYDIPYSRFEEKPLPPDLNKKRSAAKSIVFGLAYGRGANSLAQQIEVTPEEAKELMNRYFATLPKVKEWLDRAGSFARMHGYATTILGRRRYFAMPPETFSEEERKKAMGEIERAGKNMPIQGCNADIVKIALPRLRKGLRPYDGRLVSTVHDEIIVDAPIEHAAAVAHTLVTIMEGTAAEVLHTQGTLKVNTRSECNVGFNWIKERVPCVVITDPEGVEFGIHHDVIDRIEDDGTGKAIIVTKPGASGEPARIRTATSVQEATHGREGRENTIRLCPKCSPGMWVEGRLVHHHDITAAKKAADGVNLTLTDGSVVLSAGDPKELMGRLEACRSVCETCP